MLDKRTQRNLNSVRSLERLLREVAESSKVTQHHRDLLPFLRTQGAIASLELNERGLHRIALNTLKRIANDHLVGGFDGLDALRKTCLGKLEPVNNATDAETLRPDSKRSLQLKVHELQRRLDLLNEDFAFLSERLGLLMRQGRAYASEAGPDTVARCRREQREMLDSLGLRPRVGGLNGTSSVS